MSFIKIIITILMLGIVIFVHELGHFLLAKKNGITVTEFSIGMGPRITSFVKGGTRYSLKALPIGGSCMMLGEDESVDDEGAFDKKGVWARFSVLFAGGFFNFILAFVLALVVLGANGIDIPTISSIEEGSAADIAGLKEGDLITEINGSKINISREIMLYEMFNPVTDESINISYIRDGEERTVTIKADEIVRYQLGFQYTPNEELAVIEPLLEEGPMAKAGIVPGDIIKNIEGTVIKTGSDISEYFKANPMTTEPVTITYYSVAQDNDITINLTPEKNVYYEMGYGYNYFNQDISTLNVIKYSFYELKYNIVSTIKSLGYLVTGRIGMDNVAGPVGVVNIVGQIVDVTEDYGIGVTLLELANFIILISANLGVLNLLPIPALDGGRIIFLLIEAVRGKPVPKDKEAIVHLVGMALLFGLMIFVLFNDVKNIFG